jgi:hypothetical protein
MRKFFLIIWCSLLWLSMMGQNYVGLVTQEDSVSIGQPFDVEVVVQVEGSNPTGIIDFSTIDTMVNLLYDLDTTFFNKEGDIEIIDGGPFPLTDQSRSVDISNLPMTANNGGSVYKGNIKLAIYDVGQYRIPNPGLIIDGNSLKLPTSSPLITVFLPDEIQSATQDSLAVAPIKTIIEEPLTIEDFTLPLIALGILIASIALIYFFRSRRKDPSIHEATAIKEPAHVIARRKLYELRDKELWQKGEIKNYQSELTYIIREYIENRYDIRALEMTTYEILNAIPKEVDQQQLKNILQIADMVKFAKADPPVDIHSRFMDMAMKIVEDTKQIENPTEEHA